MSRNRPTPRQPATKFAHLRKKLQQKKRPVKPLYLKPKPQAK